MEMFIALRKMKVFTSTETENGATQMSGIQCKTQRRKDSLRERTKDSSPWKLRGQEADRTFHETHPNTPSQRVLEA
jgi:hypothetical protein